MKEKAFSKRTLSTRSMVFWKSSSVSPGKPTMMSVVMAIPGRAARSFSRRSRYHSTV